MARREHDLLGALDLPDHARYGIQTARALENFPVLKRPVHPRLARAYGAVKLAALKTNRALGYFPDPVTADAIERACHELIDGTLAPDIIVDALQGGAGTSTNFNVNEVLANRALELLGRAHGDYAVVSPSDHLNLHQSTNDTFPTALRIAAIRALQDLERTVVALQETFQTKERDLAHVVKVGRTEYQDAVLTTLGREMSAYAEALSRDRWRLAKCEERLRVVNLGGTAIGTGIAAPRDYIFRVVDVLRDVTGIGLARAENLVDATQNADVFVEVSGLLKALASTLIKIASDLRLMSSGPEAGLGEIRLPARQAGSSIMPGKVNPVIPEAVTQAALLSISHDQALTMAASMGSLELNAFFPLVAHTLLESFDLLTSATTILRTHCVEGLGADEARCRRHVENATASATALLPLLGYEKSGGTRRAHPRIRAGTQRNRGGRRIRDSRAIRRTDVTRGGVPARLRCPKGRTLMQSTPKTLRLHIGIFGRRNVGKSSLLNAITRQQVSIVSDHAGTTTDPVEKPMELLPLGPVLFVDTAGLDDEGALGELRMQRTRAVLERVDLGIIVTEAGAWGPFEDALAHELAQRKIPATIVVNKTDVRPLSQDERLGLARIAPDVVSMSALQGVGVVDLREALLRQAPPDFFDNRRLVADLVPPGEVAVLVVPIDKEAPKGRLILPQVMAIRDLLDGESLALVTQERELRQALASLAKPPALVVTDSQAFLKVAADVPSSVPMTSFSILMARFQGDLPELVRGALGIERLKAGDRVLMAETCSHHPIGDDIGRVKIPRWLTQYVGAKLAFTHVQGRDFPDDVTPFAVAIHCGNCTGNRREMLSRIHRCREAGVPITNYGLTIAYSLGIFERALGPFPAAQGVYRAAKS